MKLSVLLVCMGLCVVYVNAERQSQLRSRILKLIEALEENKDSVNKEGTKLQSRHVRGNGAGYGEVQQKAPTPKGTESDTVPGSLTSEQKEKAMKRNMRKESDKRSSLADMLDHIIQEAKERDLKRDWTKRGQKTRKEFGSPDTTGIPDPDHQPPFVGTNAPGIDKREGKAFEKNLYQLRRRIKQTVAQKYERLHTRGNQKRFKARGQQGGSMGQGGQGGQNSPPPQGTGNPPPPQGNGNPPPPPQGTGNPPPPPQGTGNPPQGTGNPPPSQGMGNPSPLEGFLQKKLNLRELKSAKRPTLADMLDHIIQEAKERDLKRDWTKRGQKKTKEFGSPDTTGIPDPDHQPPFVGTKAPGIDKREGKAFEENLYQLRRRIKQTVAQKYERLHTRGNQKRLKARGQQGGSIGQGGQGGQNPPPPQGTGNPPPPPQGTGNPPPPPQGTGNPPLPQGTGNPPPQGMGNPSPLERFLQEKLNLRENFIERLEASGNQGGSTGQGGQGNPPPPQGTGNPPPPPQGTGNPPPPPQGTGNPPPPQGTGNPSPFERLLQEKFNFREFIEKLEARDNQGGLIGQGGQGNSPPPPQGTGNPPPESNESPETTDEPENGSPETTDQPFKRFLKESLSFREYKERLQSRYGHHRRDSGFTGSPPEGTDYPDNCPCLNEGTCFTRADGRVACDCENGYYGRMCEFGGPELQGTGNPPPQSNEYTGSPPEGTDNPGSCQCLNGGTCVRRSGGRMGCDCEYGYYGRLCELEGTRPPPPEGTRPPLPEGTNNPDQCPCLNGGTCFRRSGGRVGCDCEDGYYGRICEFGGTDVPNQSSSEVTDMPSSEVTPDY